MSRGVSKKLRNPLNYLGKHFAQRVAHHVAKHVAIMSATPIAATTVSIAHQDKSDSVPESDSGPTS
jgi:menaquinone-dependent protoporphyrinogen IX oxidase